MTGDHYIIPDWPASAAVRAVVTTRQQGESRSPYDSFNLASHVGDSAEAVAANRSLLHEELRLPGEPLWLNQVHGRRIVRHGDSVPEPEADGSYSGDADEVCAVLTADCLPVLLCNRAGTEVAAVHAGWRGLADGVIGAAVDLFKSPPDQIIAWLGPAIGPGKFEVGRDVHDAFVGTDPAAADAFRSTDETHWMADLYWLARLQLQHLDINQVSGGQFCTASEPDRFYSYRRDGVTGRMASLIWIEN